MPVSIQCAYRIVHGLIHSNAQLLVIVSLPDTSKESQKDVQGVPKAAAIFKVTLAQCLPYAAQCPFLSVGLEQSCMG
jgi:hypothetical protein